MKKTCFFIPKRGWSLGGGGGGFFDRVRWLTFSPTRSPDFSMREETKVWPTQT
jgi:hypothetical protein